MADAAPARDARAAGWHHRIDRVWLLVALLPLVLWLADPGRSGAILGTAAQALRGTLPFIVFAVLAIGALRACSAEGLVARAFEGRESRMIIVAALAGGLAPFCSCEVIPFVAALLAAGTPLSAVMAFWLASPLMDPAMFLVTAGALGPDFALGKAAAAVGMGMAGGFAVRALAASALFADPLRPDGPAARRCCGSGGPGPGTTPRWDFWRDPVRRTAFRTAVAENALFLGKWLALAYILEGMMIAHVPAEAVADLLGGDGPGPILLGALVGAPAYLNGYAAVPLVAGLMEQGMSPGAAMSFMLAGGVSCIPAAVAVWALVHTRVFAAYLVFALAGSFGAGMIWSAVA